MLPETLTQYAPAAALENQDADAILGGHNERNEPTLFIAPAKIVDVCRFMKNAGFLRLSGITAVDWAPAEPRFEVVYLLHSIEKNLRLRLKCRIGEGEEINTATSVWRAANWYEREVFDMFGIRFSNHPNLTRILMPTDWEGYPLRKDYPVHGHKYSYQDE